MTSEARNGSWPADRVVLLGMLIFTLLLTLKYFPGFEQSHPYSGNAYQVIHPDAFVGDPYKSPDKPLLQRPFQLSLLYAFVWLGGELWLDDRFVVFIYLGLVLAGLAGMDRIVRLLGIEGPIERLLILSLFLKDHAVLNNNVQLAHQPDVNHFALAIPIIVWLTYATLARKRLWIIILLSALLAATSVRNAVFPILFNFAVVFVRGTKRERYVIAGLCAVGIVVAGVGLLYLYPLPGDLRLKLWDLITVSEAHTNFPFAESDWNPGMPYADNDWVRASARNILWLVIFSYAILAIPSINRAFRDIKLILLVGLIVWLVSCLYIPFAPDILKMPLLLPLGPVRALALPQNLAYVVIAAGLLHRLRQDPSHLRLVEASAIFGILVVIGPGNHLFWASLIAGSFIAVALMRRFVPRIGQAPSSFLALSLGFVMVVSFAIAAWQKAPAWRTLVQTGIYGDSISAAWIGVAEYIRANTPANATVLPLYHPVKGKQDIAASRTLGTRAGRPMPVPEYYGELLNPEFWEFTREQRRRMSEVLEAFEAHDLEAAAARVSKLVPIPDYIVIPTDTVEPLDDHRFPYVEQAKVRDYTILRRRS